ncbi:MAG: hypothetical protein DRJ14_04220 [Acidobacteria bacterium]|nr:MAG: hypothetical protein DRJ14_04220 [Acidobacteriota bacterium]
MSAKALFFLLSLTASTVLLAATPSEVKAIVKLNHGESYKLKEISIPGSAEGNAFWFTEKGGLSRHVFFSSLISINRKKGKLFITLLRTGTEPVEQIEDMEFRGKTKNGDTVFFRLRDLKSLQFITAKCDKICPLGHIWRDTDYLFCPYDGLRLKILQKTGLQDMEKKETSKK